MSKPLKLGIVGLGRAGYTMHLREIESSGAPIEIVAVCDVEEDRCEKMKEKFRCKTYVNVEDLVEDSEVEVVDIATRSCDHFKHAKTALEAGKIVFLEKPITQTYAEAKILMELNEKLGGNKLFVRHNRRFEAKFTHVNKIIESGILGDVYLIRRNTNGFEYRCDWQTLSQYGGGQLLNWGPHIVDQSLRFCGGDYKRMYAVTKQIVAKGDCEDFVRVVFEGINDRTVEMEISGGTAIDMPEYIVYGTRGALVDCGQTYKIKYLPSDFEAPEGKADPHSPAGSVFHPGAPIPFVEEEKEWETNKLDHTWTYLYETVREGKPYPIKNDEALKVMEVITEIKKQNQKEI